MQEMAKDEIHSTRPLATIFGVTDLSIRQLVRDIDTVSALLNREHRMQLTGEEFQGILISLGYRLTKVPVDSRIFDGVQRGCILGLISLFTSLLYQFGRKRHLKYDLLCQKLEASILDLLANPSCSRTNLMWLLVMGGISVFEKEREAWLLPKIALLGKSLGLITWESVLSELQQFPWIGPIHTAQGKCLWEKSQGHIRDDVYR